jgi:vacuolar protein sorting-associated protein 13A/C
MAQQKIKDASAAVAEAAKSNVVDAYVQATRMRLIVKINAPIIIVPVASDSLEAIAIDLGHLNISNNFMDINVQDERSPAVIDEMRIELKDMKVSKVSVRQSVADISSSSSIAGSEDIVYGLNTGTNILNPTTFSLLMQRNLSFSWFKDRPEIDISGRLKDIEVDEKIPDGSVVNDVLLFLFSS